MYVVSIKGVLFMANSKDRKYKPINTATLSQDIDSVVISFFEKFNIDIYDSKQCNNVSHNMLTLCFREVYNKLFKPDKPLFNNQKSLLDYDDMEQLTIVAESFLNWCMWFNKSLGLIPFSYMTGISSETLRVWSLGDNETNPARSVLIKRIQEGHKQAQINLLNGSPVGALAVANNDIETGLEWSKNTAQQLAANTVYLIPSERSDKLRLEKLEE